MTDIKVQSESFEQNKTQMNFIFKSDQTKLPNNYLDSDL